MFTIHIFSKQKFYGNYSTLDSRTNTAISHTFARQDGVENCDKVYCYLCSTETEKIYKLYITQIV